MTTNHQHPLHPGHANTRHIATLNMIVPEILKLINPTSVVEIGCGDGYLLHVMKQAGVQTILGYDAIHPQRNVHTHYLNAMEYVACNLESKIEFPQKFDLAVSLEIAEHLSPIAAQTYVNNLATAANIVLFSAAIPHQNHQHNINEQWLSYWQALFLKCDFILHDLLRPKFWNNPDMFAWGKQNLVLFAHKDQAIKNVETTQPIVDMVHPDCYLSKIRRYEKALNLASRGIKHYLSRPFTTMSKKDKHKPE